MLNWNWIERRRDKLRKEQTAAHSIWHERDREWETNIDRQKWEGLKEGMGGEFVEKSGFLFPIKAHSLTFLPLSGNDSPSNLGHVIHSEAHPPTACVSLSVCIYMCVCVSLCAFYCVCYELVLVYFQLPQSTAAHIPWLWHATPQHAHTQTHTHTDTHRHTHTSLISVDFFRVETQADMRGVA